VSKSGFKGQLEPVRLDLGASTKVDAEGVEARSTAKLEYVGCYLYDRGNRSSHLLWTAGEWIGPHLNIL